MPSRPSRARDDLPAGGPPPALVDAVDRIGDRWSLLTVDALRGGPRRFGELSDQLANIAPNVLSRRLRQLEADGIITSAAYSRRPVRLTYELTDAGLDLASALEALIGWGDRHHRRADDATPHHGRPAHRACGSALELRWWCPTCEETATPESLGHPPDEPHPEVDADVWL